MLTASISTTYDFIVFKIWRLHLLGKIGYQIIRHNVMVFCILKCWPEADIVSVKMKIFHWFAVDLFTSSVISAMFFVVIAFPATGLQKFSSRVERLF